VADDIRTLSSELARDPDSLVFLELGEVLRSRGQLYLAAKVAVTGLDRHPRLADAHDLYARILADMGHPEQAQEEWSLTLGLDPRHCGAHKGLGFLAYRWGDLDKALEHLEWALAADPLDSSVVEALKMVRRSAEAAAATASEAGLPPVFAGLEGAEHGLLLLDTRGRVLAGGMKSATGADVSNDVAAYVAGGAQEAERTSRILELGDWQWMVIEGSAGNLHISRPETEAALLVARDRSVPSGRLSILADRATRVAKAWIEAQEP